MSREFEPTRLYIKRHGKTGKLYFGKHNGPKVERYLGSGVDWNLHLDEHGKQFVEHIWNSDWFYDESEIKSFALSFSKIFDIVKSTEWANKVIENGVNSGGIKGMVTVKDKDDNYYQVPITDPRYLSGELVHYSTGMVTVKDKDGKTCRVTVDDPRYLSGELVALRHGMVSAKDKEGNNIQVTQDDPRWESGEITATCFGKVVVKDKSGTTVQVDKDDPRYLSGELIGINTGAVVVKDKSGNRLQVSKDDPRIKTGVLVSANKGLMTVVDKSGNKIRLTKDDPRWDSDEFKRVGGISHGKIFKKSTCPHCGVTGGINIMPRYHFDKCDDNPAKVTV